MVRRYASRSKLNPSLSGFLWELPVLRRPQKTPPTDPIDTLLDPPPSERVTLPEVPQALVKQRLRDALARNGSDRSGTKI
jgi:hypothetical protein